MEAVNKVSQGSPHVVDFIQEGKINLILNTPLGPVTHSDGALIRAAATRMNVPLLTTLSAAAAAVAAIRALRQKDLKYRSLQEHYAQQHKLNAPPTLRRVEAVGQNQPTVGAEDPLKTDPSQKT